MVWDALRDIAMIQIWFQPLFAWVGLATVILLIITLVYGYGLVKGWSRSISTHMYLALLTLITGFIHGVLAATMIF